MAINSFIAFRNVRASAVFVTFFGLEPGFCDRRLLRAVSLCDRPGNGSISTFSINSEYRRFNGYNPAGVIAGRNPWRVTFDPTGEFAYVPDEDMGNEI